jgi:hypothetical protein
MQSHGANFGVRKTGKHGSLSFEKLTSHIRKFRGKGRNVESGGRLRRLYFKGKGRGGCLCQYGVNELAEHFSGFVR